MRSPPSPSPFRPSPSCPPPWSPPHAHCLCWLIFLLHVITSHLQGHPLGKERNYSEGPRVFHSCSLFSQLSCSLSINKMTLSWRSEKVAQKRKISVEAKILQEKVKYWETPKSKCNISHYWLLHAKVQQENTSVHQDDHHPAELVEQSLGTIKFTKTITKRTLFVHQENILFIYEIEPWGKNWTKIWEWLKRKTRKKLHTRSQQDKNHLYRLSFVTYHLSLSLCPNWSLCLPCLQNGF